MHFFDLNNFLINFSSEIPSFTVSALYKYMLIIIIVFLPT